MSSAKLSPQSALADEDFGVLTGPTAAVPGGLASASVRIDEQLKAAAYLQQKLAYHRIPNTDDPVVQNLYERNARQAEEMSPCDQRIQNFLGRILTGVPGAETLRLPTRGDHLVMDMPGLARVASIPENQDQFISEWVKSYRLANDQGILHNPKNAQRTTAGSFFVVDAGLPVAADKIKVTPEQFAAMLREALNPPAELMTLPYTAGWETPHRSFASLYIRPLVSPHVPGVSLFSDGFAPLREQRSEMRFFVPGSLVSNLDFVESIFGNEGNPYLFARDAALKPFGWTGTSACVIVAPHLAKLFNNGNPFKVTARDGEVMVTLIADNYFGYCKKEVKTHISFAANLLGMGPEEHSGAAQVFRGIAEGESFNGASRRSDHTFKDTIATLGDRISVQSSGFAIDKQHPQILYVPEDTHIDLQSRTVSWQGPQGPAQIPLDYEKTFIYPSGAKVSPRLDFDSRNWTLVRISPLSILCDKDFTESGGGKSEISKRFRNAIRSGSIYLPNFTADMDEVDRILQRSYGDRFIDPDQKDDRAILDDSRSLGSVIKLLTPSSNFKPEYNAWLESIGDHIKSIVFVVKALHRPEMNGTWRKLFTVDDMDGGSGKELKFKGNKLSGHYARVGFNDEGGWRLRSLRQDFSDADKIQRGDDITATVVVPSKWLPKRSFFPRIAPAAKFIANCEERLFQRPDDGIIRGYDAVTERDFARPNQFFCNYEPLPASRARELIADKFLLGQYTKPLQDHIAAVAKENSRPFVLPSDPVLDAKGKPSKNPRYLQLRLDKEEPLSTYLAEVGERLHLRTPEGTPILSPVTDLLPGQRLSPTDIERGTRTLAVFGPIHHLETPELFMKVIASLTVKSPSTTGAGSEGALTKGPFNALLPIHDLNDRLTTLILTGEHAFVTATGSLGPRHAVDHDISLIIPELWSRMSAQERSPGYLIDNGLLERVKDFTLDRDVTIHGGQVVPKGTLIPASRLGWRINEKFAATYLGRMFNYPTELFTPDMLRPEEQGLPNYVDGILNITDAQRNVAENYFKDGGIEKACPPLKALLHIMRDGHYEGKTIDSREVRELFALNNVLESDWYKARLEKKQAVEIKRWTKNIANLEAFRSSASAPRMEERLRTTEQLAEARDMLARVISPDFVQRLKGSIGRDPSL